jgi:hypothetical protein
MLRTKCIWCGKTVKGGDDWSGRSGRCPNCDAEIFFPKIGPTTGPETVTSKMKSVVEYPNLGAWATLAVVAATGVSLWIWVRLIIFFAYGTRPYFWTGLRVTTLSKTRGIKLNNGDELNIFWLSLFMTGFITLWFLLMRGADYIAGRFEPRRGVLFLIFLASSVTWYSLLYQIVVPPRQLRISFYPSPGWQVIRISFAVLLVGGLVMWRRWMTREEPPT